MGDIPKIFFDTNIYINYFWALLRTIESKSRGEEPELKGRLAKDKELFDKYENYEFELFWSIWGYWEFKQKIHEQLYQRKCVLYGYMPKEYHEAKENVPDLTIDELELFSNTTETLLNSIPHEKRNFQNINESEIHRMVTFGCGFMDSVLFYHAYKNDCDFFVTRDEEFISKISAFCLIQKIKTQVVKPDFMLSRLKEGICWSCGGETKIEHEEHEIGSRPDDEPLGRRLIDYSECKGCGKKIVLNEETI